MRKLVLTLVFALLSTCLAQAQLQFGVKAGLNYNTGGELEEVKNKVTTIIDTKGDGKTGYHAGLWLRAKLPVLGLHLRPEVVYTQTTSEYNVNTKSADFTLQKIDVPVLLGTKFFGIASAFVGPSFQYVLDSEFKASDIKDMEKKDFSVGMQLGVGIELGQLGVDVRWERGLSSSESSWLQNSSSTTLNSITIDTRPNQIIFSLSYRFEK